MYVCDGSLQNLSILKHGTSQGCNKSYCHAYNIPCNIIWLFSFGIIIILYLYPAFRQRIITAAFSTCFQTPPAFCFNPAASQKRLVSALSAWFHATLAALSGRLCRQNEGMFSLFSVSVPKFFIWLFFLGMRQPSACLNDAFAPFRYLKRWANATKKNCGTWRVGHVGAHHTKSSNKVMKEILSFRHKRKVQTFQDCG